MILLLAFTVLIASTQVRDAAAPAAAGTASIAGAVVSDTEPSRPLRRATVTINGEGFSGRTAFTDDAGRFAFTALPEGRYTLTASKRGWVGATYGAKAIGRPGRSIQLAAASRVTASLRLARAAVITGTVLDANGIPPTDVTLRVMKYGFTPNTGERRLVPLGSSLFGSGPSVVGPDDRGAYRIYGLAPGEYYVSLAGGSRPIATGRDMHLTSDVDVQEALKAVQAGPGSRITDVPQRQVGMATVFYPGTPSIAQAAPIAVRAGEERSGVDFTVPFVSTSHVSGVVTGPSGSAEAGTRVTLVLNDSSSAPLIGPGTVRNMSTAADGRFDFAEVAPGPYLLNAHVTVPRPSGSTAPIQALSASAGVEVVGEDVRDVTLMLEEPINVSGSIRYEGAGPPPNLTSFRVSLTPLQPSAMSLASGVPTTTADGSFNVSLLNSGRHRLVVTGLPGVQWSIRAATGQGPDPLDMPLDVRRSISDLVITVTDRLSELKGRVDASTNAPADYSIVLFSTDRTHWTPMSRRIQSARTASDGTYVFRNVPPGEYHLAAVDDVEPGEWFDPSFLQRMVPGAMTIAIAQGEKNVQDIRVGGVLR